MKDSFFGLFTPIQFGTYYFFAIVGLLISVLLQTTVRNPISQTTPYRFSWKFLFLDNWKRTVLSILLIYVGIRFSTELLHVQMSEITALFMGLGLDKVAQYLKNNTNMINQKKD